MPTRKFTSAPMLQPRFNGRADNRQWPVSSDHGSFSYHNTSSYVILRTITRGVAGDLGAQAGTTGLDGLNLSLAPWQTVETLGKVGPVEVLTLLGLNGAQRSTCVATNSALSERSTTKGTVLLGLGTVGSERVGQNTGRRSGVRTRRVVNRFCSPSRVRK